VTLFNQTLNECRWLYNHFLEERKYLFEEYETFIGLYDQFNEIPILKNGRESFHTIYSQVLRDVATRVDLAFKAFYQRAKHGGNPGYPRFKGEGWYDSFTYTQSGYSIKKNYVVLSKIGEVKVNIHRPIIGKPKNLLH
jgi:putative transposase